MARVTASQATGTSLAQNVNVGGSEYLTLIAVSGPTATAAGDISVTVLPFLDDADTTLVPVSLSLPVLDSAAAVLASSKAWIFARYRVAGLHKVQIQAKNNNVGTLPVEIDFDLG